MSKFHVNQNPAHVLPCPLPSSFQNRTPGRSLTINGLKTPSNRKITHARQKVRELYLSGFQ